MKTSVFLCRPGRGKTSTITFSFFGKGKASKADSQTPGKEAAPAAGDSNNKLTIAINHDELSSNRSLMTNGMLPATSHPSLYLVPGSEDSRAVGDKPSLFAVLGHFQKPNRFPLQSILKSAKRDSGGEGIVVNTDSRKMPAKAVKGGQNGTHARTRRRRCHSRDQHLRMTPNLGRGKTISFCQT
jgi:hypothetical protein